jgi:Holliday junction resolvasome RuvABC endonuclease subunit
MSVSIAKSILALDLGTTTGWCVGSKGHHISGTWNLKPGRFDGGGMRFVKFRSRLAELHESSPVSVVYFEEVRRHAGTDAAHVYGGLMATLTAWCETEGIPYEGVPVGQIKRAFTGKGNADKARMMSEAFDRGYSPIDDNEADSIALFLCKVDEIDGAQQGKVQVPSRALQVEDSEIV